MAANTASLPSLQPGKPSALPGSSAWSGGAVLSAPRRRVCTQGRACASVAAQQSQGPVQASADNTPLERRTLLVGATTALAVGAANLGAAGAAHAGDKVAGEAFPASDIPGFAVFTPGPTETPAIRAGTVQPYSFVLPNKWVQLPVRNAISGNYCQPRCGEPTVEVNFEGRNEGSLQVWITPEVKLTRANESGTPIDGIGSPLQIIEALGPYVTGNFIDIDEDVVSYDVVEKNGIPYYEFELFTPFALTGVHNVASVTAVGSSVVLLAVSASEGQWSTSEDKLRTIQKSFTCTS
mmetsp:Transcript_5735/g.20882  ORF Transcript_5735/g.20882 Transcript_5735/m.20882 type:complete len:294 (-) Transcript_5735:3065-3946(-)